MEELGALARAGHAQRLTGTILAFEQAIGNAQVPVREPRRARFDPCADAGFAGMDLLATADETHDQRPSLVPVHVLDQELGF
jgi:hypothetical protein